MNTQAGVCPEGVSMGLGRLNVRLTYNVSYFMCSLPWPYEDLKFPFYR